VGFRETAGHRRGAGSDNRQHDAFLGLERQSLRGLARRGSGSSTVERPPPSAAACIIGSARSCCSAPLPSRNGPSTPKIRAGGGHRWRFGCADQGNRNSRTRRYSGWLEETEHRHLIRIWNYLPEINRDAGGDERLPAVQFGAPTGLPQIGFRPRSAPCPRPVPWARRRGARYPIYFLAARQQPKMIENPRQNQRLSLSAEVWPA